MHPHFFIGPQVMTADLDRVIDERVTALGYELVELERAGSKARPILRARIDVQGGSTGEPGTGVTVDDLAKVSRDLEAYLDEAPNLAERYVLEVSSPGVERPLLRTRDFEMFAGREIAVKLSKKLPDGSRRVEGELLGLERVDGVERIRLRRSGATGAKTDGQEIQIPREDVARAHLIFRWKDRR
jgi:ribosome maturation factor RimP